MTPEEKAYLAYQNELNLQPGDVVQVMFKVSDFTGGWAAGWAPKMDNCVGRHLKVIAVFNSSGIVLKCDDTTYLFPAFCLKIISRASDKKSKFGGKEYTERDILQAFGFDADKMEALKS